MKQQHYPIDLKTYEKGINSDSNKEILGSSEGEHVDALNMRSVPMDGDNFAKKKIKGEDLKYPALDNRCFVTSVPLPGANTYECMLTLEVNGNTVEAWASTSPETYDPYMRINGQIVLMSPDFPVSVDYPLQYDKNESCIGGEIYITNNITPPMVFNIKDMMENSGMLPNTECSQKYFGDFAIEEYTVNVSAVFHKPQFVTQATGGTYDKIFGTGGLPVGSYSYAYRYVTPDGDRSAWSPLTELIPVIRNVDTSQNQMPGLRSYSSDPNVASPTSYGNHIQIRTENYLGFDFIEVRRDSWYTGSLIGTAPISAIVGLVNCPAGVSILNVLDKCNVGEEEEILTITEQTSEMSGIDRAKSIRYFNERLYLMNIGYASRDIDNTVEFVPNNNGEYVFPAIHKMGKLGHKSTYNGAHYKSNMRGDVVGFGVAVFDANGNISYVKKITGAESFQFPERRDAVTQSTLGVSYKGVSVAAYNNTTGGVKAGNTHEVFDHEDAQRRTEDMVANIFEANISPDPWNPFNPTGQGDTISDYDKRVNTDIKSGNFTTSYSYNPKGFGLNYYSMGIGFTGIDTSSISLPSWVSGFSVVQTDSAKRVVAQGMAWYDMQQADGAFGANGTKTTNGLWIYIPDADPDCGGINTQVIDDLLANFNTGYYKLEAVSPLGYFSEVYSFDFDEFSLSGTRNKQADIITYSRILHDEGQMNPTVAFHSSEGVSYNGKNYVGYGSYRLGTGQCPSVYTNNQNGNHLFTITGISEYTTPSGRGTYLKVTLDTDIYAFANGGGSINEEDTSVRAFQEPMYVVNIVRDDAVVLDNNAVGYNYTGHYQKIKSLIGEGTGAPLNLGLVSERWEDCIQTISGQVNNDYDSLERFIYIEDTTGTSQRWINVTNKTTTQINLILTAIQTNGYYVANDSSGSYNVYGIYKSSEQIIGQHVQYVLNFNVIAPGSANYMIPPKGSKIYVKYDNRIPVRVFGGDTWINESVWSPIDNENGKDGNPKDSSNKFQWDMPMPYAGYKISDGIKILKNGGGLPGFHIQLINQFYFNILSPSLIRQWVNMWTAETRTNLSYAFNIEDQKESLSQYFPLKNYIMRPNKWSTSNDGTAHGMYVDNKIYADDYEAAYGNEFNNWIYGGFRFKPQTNIDYCQNQSNLNLTSVPQFGFVEKTEYCTRIIWSEKRPINVQNTPTVRTFPVENYFDISDDTGCIKFAWSALSSDKGNNLYAITDGGVCLLMIDKRIISEINANELATVGSDIGGVLNQLWIDKTIGMFDETWRSWAEYSNVLFFSNNIGAYMFTDNQLANITSGGFLELYNRKFVPKVLPLYGSKLTGGYNVLTQEYIMDAMAEEIGHSALIYGTQQKMLQCQSSYNYDKYLYIGNKFYGMKDAKTYELGIGNQIDGANMQCYVTGLSDKEIYFDKEFIRIRVNSNSKPDKIYFYDSYKDYVSDSYSSVVDATANPIAIKDYFGYECYIPRKMLAPNHRQQGRVVLFKIVSTTDVAFLVTSTGVQYKALK